MHSHPSGALPMRFTLIILFKWIPNVNNFAAVFNLLKHSFFLKREFLDIRKFDIKSLNWKIQRDNITDGNFGLLVTDLKLNWKGNSKFQLSFVTSHFLIDIGSLRRMYRYVPSQKWDSESILNTSWWRKSKKKSTFRKVLRTLILRINNFKKLLKN